MTDYHCLAPEMKVVSSKNGLGNLLAKNISWAKALTLSVEAGIKISTLTCYYGKSKW